MAIYALFFANCRQYVLLEERPLYVSVDARGEEGLRKVTIALTDFFPSRLPEWFFKSVSEWEYSDKGKF